MKRFFRFVSCTLLSLVLIFATTSFISAAYIDKADNVAVSSVASNKVVLTWDEVPDVTGYGIYRYSTIFDRYVPVGRTRQLKFTDRLVLPSRSYTYKIRAYKSNIAVDSVGPYSEEVSATTNPARVYGLTVNYLAETSVGLSWTENKSAAGYTVYLLDESSGEYVAAATTNTAECLLTGLTPGTEYNCRVAAYHEINGITYGYKSKAVVFTTAAAESPEPEVYISTPENLKAAVDSKTVIVTWDENIAATGYEVYRYNYETNLWNLIKTNTDSFFVDTSVKDTDMYTYKVRAFVEKDGETTYSDYTDSVSVTYETPITNESIYNDKLSQDGVFGYLYDPNENCFYTSSDPWQRVAGYNSLYDTFAPTTLISFDTERIRFDYKDKNWMVQIWKGQYGAAFYGAEIGVYTKPSSRNIKHYDCAEKEDWLKMSMDFYEYKKHIFSEDEWVKQFSRPYDSYWWCTGFIPGNKLGNYSTLRVDARITMKDYTMLSAFKKAIDETPISYYTSGLDVYLSYN